VAAKRWQPTPQECELIADMLDANRPKAAIARFVYVSESTLRRFLARVRARRPAKCCEAQNLANTQG
jgi:hypothetical protein